MCLSSSSGDKFSARNGLMLVALGVSLARMASRSIGKGPTFDVADRDNIAAYDVDHVLICCQWQWRMLSMCNTHGLSESAAALDLNLFADGRFEPSCELVQLLCCAHVRSWQIKYLKPGDVVLNTSGLHEAVLGMSPSAFSISDHCCCASCTCQFSKKAWVL